jgi:hypothetical protein
MCKKKENKRSQRREKIEPYVFFLRYEYLNTYVQRDKEEKKRQGNCLPSTANKKRKKKMTTTAQKKERERATIMHTHTHTHTSKMALETK